MNILEEVQQYVADKLNADSQLSACPFLVENRRDIDFEIKQALGKQGVVGLVMTPKATYAGAYMDVGIAWQIDELEIDVVENVTVNRGKKNGYVTGQDAAMRLFEVLCPLSGEHEGQFIPVSYSEGEDNSLLVNKSVLKCLVHKLPDLEMRTKVTYADGSSLMVEVEGVLSSSSIPSINDVVEVEIGNAVTSIGEHAFDRCAYLETVVIPESVETISTQGFSRTVRLTNVTIEGNGLKVIGAGAFAAATALSSISLPDSVISIGRSAFEDCVQLTSIVIPASVQIMDREVFFGCSELMNVTFSGKTKATVKGMENYSWALPSRCIIHCTDGDIVVGSTSVVYQDGQQQEIPIFGELTRNSIPNISNVASVNIGEAVTSIGARAFQECYQLTSVDIPDSVTDIWNSAFSYCIGLTSVDIPDSVTSIGNYAFSNCIGLTSMMIGNGVTIIWSYAFSSCSELKSITFSGKTKATVQGMANYNSWGLPSGCVLHCTDGDLVVGSETKVTYQNGDVVEYDIQGQLSRGQISNLTNIVSLDIGRGVTSLGTNAFYSCTNLSSVTIPNSVSSIGTYAFGNCYRLTSISLPDSVTNLSGSTFYDCTGLKSASLGNGLSAIPGAIFSGCSNLSSVTLPMNAIVFGEGAFGGCTSLRSIDIPDSVSSLNNSAFRNCYNLVDVHMPSSLKIIQEYAFENCRSLSSVTIPESVGFIGADAFHGCTTVANVYCYPYWDNLNWDEADKDDFKQDGSTICHVRQGYLGGYVSKFGNTVNVTFAGDLA